MPRVSIANCAVATRTHCQCVVFGQQEPWTWIEWQIGVIPPKYPKWVITVYPVGFICEHLWTIQFEPFMILNFKSCLVYRHAWTVPPKSWQEWLLVGSCWSVMMQQELCFFMIQVVVYQWFFPTSWEVRTVEVIRVFLAIGVMIVFDSCAYIHWRQLAVSAANIFSV